MGNSLSSVLNGVKRLKNRYNAQYRALEYISKENRQSAPRHPGVPVVQVEHDASLLEELQKKDLKLNEYLKNVYVNSHDKVPYGSDVSKNNPERPLPESREPRQMTFMEPEEVEKGWCTITQICEFIARHEEDPVANSCAVIAQNYDLKQKQVENTLKYFTVFRVYDKVQDTLPRAETEVGFEESLQKVLEGNRKNTEIDGASGESARKAVKAIKS